AIRLSSVMAAGLLRYRTARIGGRCFKSACRPLTDCHRVLSVTRTRVRSLPALPAATAKGSDKKSRRLIQSPRRRATAMNWIQSSLFGLLHHLTRDTVEHGIAVAELLKLACLVYQSNEQASLFDQRLQSLRLGSPGNTHH